MRIPSIGVRRDCHRLRGDADRPRSCPAAVEPDPLRWQARIVLVIAPLMVVLDASIVNIALPWIQADLGISDTDRQWAITAYALGFGSVLLLGSLPLPSR
ncbi:MAG: hypothetical protein ACYC90_00765 [Candidatus Nanopelagicales bacterium]